MTKVLKPGLWQFLLTVIVATAFIAVSVDAKPGARGGGFSRGGPAAGGSHHGHHREHQHKRNRAHLERRDNRKDFHDDRWKRRAARHLTRAVWASQTCAVTTVYYNSMTYYRCGGVWYNRGYHSGDVVYVVVVAPPGY